MTDLGDVIESLRGRELALPPRQGVLEPPDFSTSFGFEDKLRRWPVEGSSTGSPWHPFRVVQSSSGKVVVYYGTINNLVPNNAMTEISVTTGYIGLDVTATGYKQITAVSLTTFSTPAPPDCVEDHPPSTFKVPLAYLSVSGGAVSVSQIWNCNLVAQVALCAQVEKSSVVIGQSPWTNWFTWSVGAELNVRS